MSRSSGLLTLVLCTAAIATVLADDRDAIRIYPNVAKAMKDFSERPLEQFAGTKQLRLRTHDVKEGRLVVTQSPIGSSGWDVVPIEPRLENRDRFAVRHGDLFLRYDPAGEDPLLTLAKEQDEGTLWRATLSASEVTRGVDRHTFYTRTLRLEVVNGPKKGWVAAYVGNPKLVDDGLSLAVPEDVKAKQRHPVRFVFRTSYSHPDDGK